MKQFEYLDYRKILKDKNVFSEEAYFGSTNELSIVLDKHVEMLMKELTENNYAKSKKINEILDSFGEGVAKVLNFEKVYFTLMHEANAYSASYFSLEYGDVLKADKNGVIVSVNNDVQKQLMSVIVQTDKGYRFKKAKGNICFVCIGIPYLTSGEYTVREVSGIICHELGHAIEHGVLDFVDSQICFTLFNAVNDPSYSMLLDQLQQKNTVLYTEDDEMDNLFLGERNSKGQLKSMEKANADHAKIKELSTKNRSFFGFLKYLSSSSKGKYKMMDVVRSAVDSMISEIKTPFKDASLSKYYKKRVSNGNYKNPDNEFDNIKALALWSSVKSGKLIEERTKKIKDEVKEAVKNYYKYNTVAKSWKRVKMILFPFSLVVNVAFSISELIFAIPIDLILRINEIFSRRFMLDVKYKKLEQFADIFANTYGYGAELGAALSRHQPYIMTTTGYTGKTDISTIGRGFTRHIPIINILKYFTDYRVGYMTYFYDIHGTNDERMNNMYIHLKNELNNIDNIEMRKDIEQQMEKIKKNYDEIVTGKGVGSITYRILNKLIISKKFGVSGKGGYDGNENLTKCVLEEYAKIIKDNSK